MTKEEWMRKNRGSRCKCLELMSGEKSEVAKRLQDLVNIKDVSVCKTDEWMPNAFPFTKPNGDLDTSGAKEAHLGSAKKLFHPDADVRKNLNDWWLVSNHGNTPAFDIACCCKIEGRSGLILVEAKAHKGELEKGPKRLKKDPSETSEKNHDKIGKAIEKACTGLADASKEDFKISHDNHYQLSNRFAWSWKLASLGCPVVLIYLGFLNAAPEGTYTPFTTEEEWKTLIIGDSRDVVPEGIWGKKIIVADTPFYPIIRSWPKSTS